MSRSAIAQARAWINKHAARPNDGHAPHLAPLSLAGTERESLDDLCEYRAVCAKAGVWAEDADARDYVQIVETPDLRRYRIYEVVAAGNWIELCEVTAHGEVAAAIEAMHRNLIASAEALDVAGITLYVQDLGRCEQ